MRQNIYYRQRILWLFFLFLLLAGITRFYHLNWSFWGDETSTFHQVERLKNKISPDPVGYYIQGIVYKVFGKGETESRIGVATAGTIAIALIVLLTSRLYGQVTGVILGCMVVLSPWHLFHSQNQRTYSYAFLFGAITFLTAALAWKENNRKWAIFSGVMSALTVATHTISIVIPFGIGVFVIIEYIRRQVPLPQRAIRSYLFVAAPLLLLICLWAVISWQNWSGKQTWGYSSLHTLMGLAFNLNWGITLLACAGCLWAIWDSKNSLDRMWAISVIIITLFAIVLPIFLPFRHDYVFAATLAFFMLAARVIAQIYELVKVRSLPLAITVVIVFLLAPLPSFLSYYQDGNRDDYRSAAKFIAAHYQPGDIVAARSAGLLGYYLPDFKVRSTPGIENGAEYITHVEQLLPEGKRLWLVFSLSRQEPPSQLDQWLWKNTVRMLRIKKKRFDYHENITDVYLIEE